MILAGWMSIELDQSLWKLIPWSWKILNSLNFWNKSSLNRNWFLFKLYQKRKLALPLNLETAYASEQLFSRLVLHTSRLVLQASRLIMSIVGYCKLFLLYIFPVDWPCDVKRDVCESGISDIVNFAMFHQLYDLE